MSSEQKPISYDGARRYLTTGPDTGYKCPACGSEQLGYDSISIDDPGAAQQRAECIDCGAKWWDVYKLHTLEARDDSATVATAADEVRTLQLWPRGDSLSIVYRRHEPALVREHDHNAPYGGPAPWREPTAEERDRIKAEEIAERMMREDVLFNQSSLVDDLLKEQRDGFEVDEIENLYPDPDDWDMSQCREWLDDRSISYDLDPVAGDSCPECSGILEPEEDEPDDYLQCNNCGKLQHRRHEDDEDELDNMRGKVRENAEPAEPLQWWLVTESLAEDLKAQGEPILDNDYGPWWGRTCCGQGVLMDGTLQACAMALIERTRPQRETAAD